MLRLTSALALILALAGSALAQDDANDQANAADLLNRAQQGVAFVVAAAKEDPVLSGNDTKTKPFWNGIQDTSSNLEKAKTALANQDNAFFVGLASAVAGYIQADIAVIMTGSSDPRVKQGMTSLGSVLETLNENYSKEAARLKEGGELTAKEREQLDRLIAQQDELLRKLDEVQKNVGTGNAEMQKAIAAMKEEARKLKRARRTASGFAVGFFSAHLLYDWIWGWHWWWGPWGGWCPGFIDIGIIIWDDWATEYVYDWALTEAYIDIAELELDYLDAVDLDVAAELDYLDSGDWGFDNDIAELTAGEDYGWDAVTTDEGLEIADQLEDNLDVSSVYDAAEAVETFDDYSMSDFGSDFGSDMDFGGDW